jgi:hypothetical protein
MYWGNKSGIFNSGFEIREQTWLGRLVQHARKIIKTKKKNHKLSMMNVRTGFSWLT